MKVIVDYGVSNENVFYIFKFICGVGCIGNRRVVVVFGWMWIVKVNGLIVGKIWVSNDV